MWFIAVMRSCIFSIITPVFSVTWSSEITLIFWFSVGTFPLIKVENNCAGSYFCGNSCNIVNVWWISRSFSHFLRELQQYGQLMGALEQMTCRIEKCKNHQRKTRFTALSSSTTTHKCKHERDPEPRFQGCGGSRDLTLIRPASIPTDLISFPPRDSRGCSHYYPFIRPEVESWSV